MFTGMRIRISDRISGKSVENISKCLKGVMFGSPARVGFMVWMKAEIRPPKTLMAMHNEKERRVSTTKCSINLAKTSLSVFASGFCVRSNTLGKKRIKNHVMTAVAILHNAKRLPSQPEDKIQ